MRWEENGEDTIVVRQTLSTPIVQDNHIQLKSRRSAAIRSKERFRSQTIILVSTNLGMTVSRARPPEAKLHNYADSQECAAPSACERVKCESWAQQQIWRMAQVRTLNIHHIIVSNLFSINLHPRNVALARFLVIRTLTCVITGSCRHVTSGNDPRSQISQHTSKSPKPIVLAIMAKDHGSPWPCIRRVYTCTTTYEDCCILAFPVIQQRCCKRLWSLADINGSDNTAHIKITFAPKLARTQFQRLSTSTETQKSKFGRKLRYFQKNLFPLYRFGASRNGRLQSSRHGNEHARGNNYDRSQSSIEDSKDTM